MSNSLSFSSDLPDPLPETRDHMQADAVAIRRSREFARSDARAKVRIEFWNGSEQADGRSLSCRTTHPIRREVALKLIKLGMDTKQVLALRGGPNDKR